MFTLAQIESFAQDVKKSRFLAVAGPVADEATAKAFISAHSDAGANHNCWAWRVGQAYRFSDDGEPSGTAGKPILQALDGQALDNVAVVVTRWFGGVLLGTGGLVRAYGGSASACLRASDKVPLVVTVEAVATLEFADLAIVQARLAAVPGVRTIAETFTATGAMLTLALPEADAAAVARMIADLTSGRAAVAFAD